MAINDLLSFEDAVDLVLSKANEETDGSSDWDLEARAAVVAQHRRLVNLFPWVCLEKSPPGMLLTTAAITSLTIAVAAAGIGVAVTLSAVPSRDITGEKITLGKDYVLRVLSGGTTATPIVDMVPEVIAAGTACTVYQDEYNLASDFNMLVNGLWTRAGRFIPVTDDERTRRTAWGPAPSQQGWPPRMATMVGAQRIRVSGWDTQRHPIEYPYTYNPGDPSGTGAMTIEPRLRALLVTMALPEVLDLKRGFAESLKLRQFEPGLIEEAKDTDHRRRRGGELGRLSREQSESPWG